MTEKDCVVVHRPRAGKTRFYLSKEGEWYSDPKLAARYTEAQAKRIGQRAADEYGYAVEIERVKGRGKNPVPASSKAGQRGSAKTSVQKAADLYKRFTGNKPHKKAKIVHEKDQAFLQVGTVDGILYTTNRDGKVEQYIHHFRPKSRPSLAVTADGKVARTVGGNFTFTERGFVDEDANGNPVE